MNSKIFESAIAKTQTSKKVKLRKVEVRTMRSLKLGNSAESRKKEHGTKNALFAQVLLEEMPTNYENVNSSYRNLWFMLSNSNVFEWFF